MSQVTGQPLLVPDWQPKPLLEPLHLDWLAAAGVEAAVLRLDTIDPLISGNKWFKLKPHLDAAMQAGAHGLMSLGGAHSNHLHALAAAGRRFDFPTVGLVRGHPQRTATVEDLENFGMQLHWLGYGGYRARHELDFWQGWEQRYPGLKPVPEGGGGLLGAQGCAPLVNMVQQQLADIGWDDYHGWWLAAGTGTTLAGLAMAENGMHPVYGALAVPANHGVEDHVESIFREAGRGLRDYHLLDASHGGFARVDQPLVEFLHASEAQSGVPLEPLYTGKALMALRDEVQGGRFAAGTRLVFVHTGGLQGRRGFL